jgi:hypothetical protein
LLRDELFTPGTFEVPPRPRFSRFIPMFGRYKARRFGTEVTENYARDLGLFHQTLPVCRVATFATVDGVNSRFPNLFWLRSNRLLHGNSEILRTLC